jgi:Holliday junction resolvase-like predicted endonuclease
MAVATVTFDTLKFVEKLKSAGLPEEQAKAISEAFRDASGEADLVTKQDLQIELAAVRADINLIKWMLGILLGGVMALVLKAFFPI